MNNRELLQKLKDDDQGLSTVEYLIILALIAIIAIGAWRAFGAKVEEGVTGSTNALPTVTSE